MFHLLFKEISVHLTTYVLYTLCAKVPFTGRDITIVCVTKCTWLSVMKWDRDTVTQLGRVLATLL